MLLSILILTHDRPFQFRECLNSVLKADIDINFEILINCDDDSISQITIDSLTKDSYLENKIKLFNYSPDNYGKIYKYLINKSKGKYLYFLEDDDLLITNFSYLQNSSYDYLFCKRVPDFSREPGKVINYLKYLKSFKDKKHTELFNIFKTPEEFIYFQLGDLIIKKDTLHNIPLSNNKYNDYYLFKNNIGSIQYLNNILYKQRSSHYNVS